MPVLKSMRNLRHLLREPLLHFLLIGLALFLWYGRAERVGGDPDRIVVTQGRVDALATQFRATWYREPTREELRGLVDSYVTDEMLYREGRALGLAEEDPVVRRRVRQKLEVMAEELHAQQPPSDTVLGEYVAVNVERFQRQATVTFEQITVADADANDARVSALVSDVQQALAAGADPMTLGMTSLLPASESDRPLDLVARDFGARFAEAIESLPVGEWCGPVRSGLGQHVVRVLVKEPGGTPPLEDIRREVTREWEGDRRQRAMAAHLAGLRKRYEIVIEASSSVPAPRAAAALE
jgi:hypothetical protein